jgi:formamidase
VLEYELRFTFGVVGVAWVVAIGATKKCTPFDPATHSCADFGQYLVGAPHCYALTTEELHAAKTDGHMDTNSVREGCILVCPVKVPGAGVYMGDMHAQQGNGEIAAHATDVSGETEPTVEVIKGLTIDGPILLQNVDDLPPMARPMNAAQR